jgi:hypothetical protein
MAKKQFFEPKILEGTVQCMDGQVEY